MKQEPGVWVEGPDGELVPDYESTFPEINEGEVVHGTVVRVDPVANTATNVGTLTRHCAGSSPRK